MVDEKERSQNVKSGGEKTVTKGAVKKKRMSSMDLDWWVKDYDQEMRLWYENSSKEAE